MSVLFADTDTGTESGIVRPSLDLSIPRGRVKTALASSIAGNKYDVVLICQPEVRDNYVFYDEIIRLVEERRDQRIYSPHDDVERGTDISEAVDFTVKEAIPRARGALIHLTHVTPDIQEMVEATHRHRKPFFVFYYVGTDPYNQRTAVQIRTSPEYRGEVIYEDEDDAIRQLDEQIDELLRTN